MKKIILITIVTTICFIVAAKSGAFGALFMFFLAGIIPGTDIVIPANVMLLIISTAMCGVLFFSVIKDIARMVVEYRATKSPKAPRAHLPKRRFSEI